MNDHDDICSVLKNLGPRQVTVLGEALGISYTKLMKMEDCLRLQEMVHAWINREDDVIRKCGEPTWNKLMAKLKDIGQSGIAEDIRGKCAGCEQTENCNIDKSNSNLSSELDSMIISGMSSCMHAFLGVHNYTRKERERSNNDLAISTCGHNYAEFLDVMPYLCVWLIFCM